jgi:hypothetical protein
MAGTWHGWYIHFGCSGQYQNRAALPRPSQRTRLDHIWAKPDFANWILESLSRLGETENSFQPCAYTPLYFEYVAGEELAQLGNVMLFLSLHRAMAQPEIVGTVQVPVVQLQYVHINKARQFEKSRVEFLRRAYRVDNTHKRSPQALPGREHPAHEQPAHDQPNHWIRGYVDHSQVISLLTKLRLSLERLQHFNGLRFYPRLEDHPVLHVQGLVRVEAAKIADPFQYWTVDLYATDLAAIGWNLFVIAVAEEHSHEVKYSPGDIYYKLREYPSGSSGYEKWHICLAENEQQEFSMICAWPLVAEALDKLMA